MIQQQCHSMRGEELILVEKEVYRYLGYQKDEPDERVKQLVVECEKEMIQAATPKSVYQVFDMHWSPDSMEMDLGFAQVDSEKLHINLSHCEKVILFAATIGPRTDYLIQKYSRIDTLKGVVMQAVGAMLIESYCDQINAELKEKMAAQGYRLHPRFSPGYGDFSLNHQKDIFRVLDCGQKLGITLMDSMIMAPSKSVTALIGMEATGGAAIQPKQEEAEDKCAACDNVDCPFHT
ncbi:MAG: vitamin B12 dependent-methionine synthase activation domain-containing protein [Lachnospiraceae bacterium]